MNQNRAGQKFEKSEMAAIYGLVKGAGPTINGLLAISKVNIDKFLISKVARTIRSFDWR